MAVLKIINNDYSDYNITEKIVGYILNYGQLAGLWGSNNLYCPDAAAVGLQLNNIARYYRIGGNILHHFVLSFDRDTEGWIYYDPSIACRIVEDVFFPLPHASIWNVHTDTGHLHVHIIMSAVNLMTGLKYPNRKTDHQILANQIYDAEYFERCRIGTLYAKTYGFEGCEPEVCYTKIPDCKVIYSNTPEQ